MKVFDFHVHTRPRSVDSTVSLEQAVEEAKRIGLDGFCITEHSETWNRDELREIAGTSGLLIIGGMEVTTEVGDFLLLGVDGDTAFQGLPKLSELKRAAERVGGFLIAAHPFRKLFAWEPFGKRMPSVHEIIQWDTLQEVDEVEVNGRCDDRENDIALQVAKRLGKPGIAGSDVHFRHELGRFVTVFEADVSSEDEFFAELGRGHYYPATGFRDGRLTRLLH